MVAGEGKLIVIGGRSRNESQNAHQQENDAKDHRRLLDIGAPGVINGVAWISHCSYPSLASNHRLPVKLFAPIISILSNELATARPSEAQILGDLDR